MKSTPNLDQVYSGVLRHLEEAFVIIEKTELGSYQFTDANEHACELLGYGRKELLSINPARIIDLQCWTAQLTQLGKHTDVCTIMTKDGICHFEIESTVFSEDDTVYSFHVFKKTKVENLELRYSKNLINTVADSMQTFFLVLEPDGRINQWNRFCEQETGYSLAEVKGEYVWDVLMAEPERSSFKETFFKVSEVPLTHDNHWVTKSGEQRFIQWSSAKMANEQGELEYIISVGIDITYRANFEKSLLDSENRYRTLVRSMNDLVVTIGKKGEMTSIYGKWFEADRMLEKKYLGKTMEEIFPGKSNIHREAFERAQLGEKVIYEWERIKEYEINFYQTILSPMKSAEGTDVVSVTRDISQLKKSEIREKRIYDSVATGIVSQGWDGKILFANESACEILGYSSEDLMSMSSENSEWQGIDEDGNPLSGQQHPSMVSLSTGVPVNGFVMGIFNPVKNEIRWLLVSTRLLYQNNCPNGQIETVIATFMDITEKKEWDQRIQKAEKLAVVGQLAAALAHEIRNPLTAIDGFLKLMKPALGNKEKMYLDILFDEVEKIDLVTSEFLALAKPQNERKSILHLRKNILDPVILTLAPLANMNGIAISCEYEQGDIYVLGNKNKLKQMMINLLKNALEAMPDYRKGRIYISTKLYQDTVRIIIRDEGHGISPDRLKYIGEPFYSLKEKGTGLGMMICFKIVKEHNGELRIYSEVGVGTTVEILLPKYN